MHGVFVITLLTGVISGAIGGQLAEKYKPAADSIRNYLVNGDGKGSAFRLIANLSDEFGPRPASSDAYRAAVKFAVAELNQIPGVNRVWTETVGNIPNWERGEGKAQLLEPRLKTIAVVALSNSTATPPGGITAEAVVVQSSDELAALRDDQVRGKIVVYNQPWISYGQSGQYRGNGGVRAAERGAVAALVRSVTDRSLYTVHTGIKSAPVNGVPDIPVASITVEDAELLWRLQRNGKKLKIKLELETHYFGTTTADTIIAEIPGFSHPDELVVFGCHFDSVDLGEGAMDDGGGVGVTWQALATIGQLGLRPKRTLRAVFWAAEEMGGLGGLAYYEAHKHEASAMSIVMESDTGTFNPVGLHYTGSEASQVIMREVMSLLEPINGSLLADDGGIPGDPFQFVVYDGVPGAELFSQSDKYFGFHHSNADTVTALNSDELDRGATIYATVAYVVADLDDLLPKGNDAPTTTPQSSSVRVQSSVTYAFSLTWPIVFHFL